MWYYKADHPLRRYFSGLTEHAFVERLGMADPRSVAELGYRAMEEGRAVAIPGIGNRLLALTVRLSPRALVRKVVKRLNSVAGG